MRRRDFETMVRSMTAELPPEFLEGIDAITVTPKTLPHPVREGVYTLGECVPLEFGSGHGPAELRSAVELHYGSFAALAAGTEGFDWRKEAWETLTHEVRHHLEWRARLGDLERLDDAAEANYARHEHEAFAPLFHLDGEPVAEGVTKVEDDLFLDVELEGKAHAAAAGKPRAFTWHGRRWAIPLPDDLPDVFYAVAEGLEPAPAGDVVVVIRRKPGALDALRRASVGQATLVARPATAIALD